MIDLHRLLEQSVEEQAALAGAAADEAEGELVEVVELVQVESGNRVSAKIVPAVTE